MSFERLDEVTSEVATLAAAFRRAGFRVFLVGGIVRDLWLGESVDGEGDIDLTTDARPDQIKAVIGPIAEHIWTQGERFGTIGCIVGGRAFEITTHRSDAYEPHSRKPEVAFSGAIGADLSRRDFTINAMAIEVPGGDVIDPFGGIVDLERKVLRTPVGAEQSFTDDPLRMLRAARFTARYELSPDEALVAAMESLAPRLDIVAIERVRDELDKLLAVDELSAGLLLLAATGVLERVLPGLAEAIAADDMASLRLIESVDADDRLGRLAALARADTPTSTRVEVHEWARRLRYSRDEMRAIEQTLAALDSLPGVPVDAGGLRRWLVEAGDQRERVLGLARVVHHDLTPIVRDALATLAATEDLDDLGAPLDGAQVMAHLGVSEGRIIGDALAHLAERRIAEGPMSEDDALAALDEWWSDHLGE
ncbi:MAG: CCA tRNA nucleotidyltransferase [Acidimicrobiia bacterium]|nr:CCA tRNA nucleotidyltransferase [Acidimicrobiia bacterium]